MKETIKNVLVVMLIAGLCLPIVGVATANDIIVGEISISPEEPTRLSEVTFTVEITGNDIEQVRIKVEECNEIMCYQYLLNESMTNTEGNIWTGTATLIHDDTVVGHSWLVIKSNGIWYDYRNDKTTWKNFTVVPGDNGGDNNGTDGGGNTGKKTPGFEPILVIVSIVVALFIYKKKRT
jgi:hypothetical protein